MRDIALTLLIFGLLPICMMRPWIGILVWYWFGLMNPHRLTWGFAYSLPFGVAIGGATLLGLLITRKDRKPIPWTREMVLMLVLMIYFTGTTFFAWFPDDAWPQWNKVLKIILMTYVATMFIYGRERIRALMLVIALSVGFYGIKGGIWVILTGGGERVMGPGASFLAENNHLGVGLVMIIPLLLFLAREQQGKWQRRGLYAAFGLNLIAALFTYSRGAMLGLGTIIPLLFLRTRRKFLVLLVAVPLVYFGHELLPEKLFKRADQIEGYEQDNSAMQRIRAWTVAFNIARSNPLAGAGFEFESHPNKERWFSFIDQDWRLLYGESTHSAHSIYFQVLGQHGFVAFGMYVLMLIFTLQTLQRVRRETRSDSALEWIGNYAAAIQVGLAGFMVSGAFLNLAYFDLMFLYVACTAILSRELAEARGPQPRPRPQYGPARQGAAAAGIPRSAQTPAPEPGARFAAGGPPRRDRNGALQRRGRNHPDG